MHEKSTLLDVATRSWHSQSSPRLLSQNSTQQLQPRARPEQSQFCCTEVSLAIGRLQPSLALQDGWECCNLLQVIAALLLLQALATGGTGNGAVLLQPCLKLFVMWFILQGTGAVIITIIIMLSSS